MKPRLFPLFLASIAAGLFFATARAEETVHTIAFADPSKPGIVKISLGRGDLQIEGDDTPRVVVRADAKTNGGRSRKDNLRVLSAASGFALSEKENVVTIDATVPDRGRETNFKITVPRNTTIIVQSALSGDIRCSGITGDIDINCLDGKIRLDRVAGGIVVATMNGDIRADVRELNPGRPLSFTSIKGEVTIGLPEDARANVRLRTQNGSVLTDFAEDRLVTRTETIPGASHARGSFVYKGTDGKMVTAEVSSTSESSSSSNGNSSSSSNTNSTTKEDPATGNEGSQIPTAPGIATLTISGGKLVTGTLNGGGPEITVSTMNGDVILRKLERGK